VKYPNIERLMNLHERLEVLYCVSHYEAELTTLDGDSSVAKGEGETIDEALAQLDQKIGNNTIDQLRGLE
jgi:hypothetical protein